MACGRATGTVDLVLVLSLYAERPVRGKGAVMNTALDDVPKTI